MARTFARLGGFSGQATQALITIQTKPLFTMTASGQELYLFLYCQIRQKNAEKMPSRSHGTKPILSFPKNIIRFSHLGKPALKESPPFDLFLCVSHSMTDISMYTKQTDICFLIASFTTFQQPECQHSILKMLRSSSKVEVLFKRNILSPFPILTFSSKGVA